MACFIVPATEAVVTTVAAKIIEKKENSKKAELTNETERANFDSNRFSSKLKKLNYMLWGGSGLLAFEHLWHGEVILSPPFLTAAKDAGDLAHMLQEMSTVGVSMAALVTFVWGTIMVVSERIKKRESAETLEAGEETN